MTLQIERKDWSFLIFCVGLGFLAEISFLHGSIGLSYLVFITGFYSVIFLRFRLAFNHRRIGLLFTVSIWILSGCYVIYDNQLFHVLNIIVIPVLVLSHIVLITRPNTFKWHTPHFLILLLHTLRSAGVYLHKFSSATFAILFKNMKKQTAGTVKRIVAGFLIGIPLLCIVTFLLMSADETFANVVGRLPHVILNPSITEGAFRLVFVVGSGLLFFGIIQTLQAHTLLPLQQPIQQKKHWNGMTAITVLVLLNVVYLLFVVIQFQSFFSGDLQDGITYATNARRGFFELIVVTLINGTLLISFLKKIVTVTKKSQFTLNILYSLLIVTSGIMLLSAYQRLSLYEAAYGFTVERFLAHAFMIYLLIVFCYTFIRVWIERISLLHFYLIIGLIFYTLLNVINIDQIIVDHNIERYQQTGKIDPDYLAGLSYTGLDGLIDLYESGADIPDLEAILFQEQKRATVEQTDSWQSFNFTKQRVMNRLKALDLE